MTTPGADEFPYATAMQLEGGDRIAPFALPDQDGAPATPMADHIAGKPMLLVFECATAAAASDYAQELAALRDQRVALAASATTIFAITRRSVADNRRLRDAHALPFPVLCDVGGKVYKACGLEPPPCAVVTLVADANFRVIRALGGGAVGSHAVRALAALREAAVDRPAERIGAHPPVLVVPRALSPEDCARIIQVWHRPARVWETDGMHCEGYAVETGDFKVRNESYGRVLQMVVRDRQVQQYLDAKLGRRVLPEIQKAFQTSVSQREDYRIARYDAADGGSLPPHRDNPTPETRQRRFTMSVALNAEAFTGGALRFAEYGTQEYLVPTGAAVVWSCSLLHEVLPIASGQRFILGTHLFGG